jgi:hypothetical protein
MKQIRDRRRQPAEGLDEPFTRSKLTAPNAVLGGALLMTPKFPPPPRTAQNRSC